MSGKVYGDLVPGDATRDDIRRIVKRYISAGYSRDGVISILAGTGLAKGDDNWAYSKVVGEIFDEEISNG